MKQVSKEEYYNSFNNLNNVTQEAVGDYPYNHHVKRNGTLIAKSVAKIEDHEEVRTYYISYSLITGV